MRILLVYPEYPDTFWSFKHALKFISKKASFPPLGLLTVAAMLPAGWELKLVDMNVCSLADDDLRWADFVFLSAMTVQKASARKVIRRCGALGVPVVAGGPLFSTAHEDFPEVDHFVLNEAELTLPPFLDDLKKGRPGRVYASADWPDITRTPAPRWDLVDMKKYATMSIQYSRGCPYNCEFCDIIVLNGHTPRTKKGTQLLAELEGLYRRGWRGGVFFVDDNFIGNRKKLKTEILPSLIGWMQGKRFPFHFLTEASINLADDPDLMDMMVEAGFRRVFIGIETPDEASLSECNKLLNTNRDLVACVRKIQKHGLEVQGGFIVGFDSDTPSIFERQIRFIQKSGIVTAMVGLLNAPRGTRLYQRLKEEGRLLREITGCNTDFSLNFIPRMNRETLIRGYQRILDTIYRPKHYYRRVQTFLENYHPGKIKEKVSFKACYILAFLKSVWVLGIKGRERFHFWRLLLWTLFRRPRLFGISVSFAIFGFHFRKTCINQAAKGP
ncbi:MAG: B12-binding domain-containing radical SAM protein [Candidatus Aminicenantales bacterium]